MILKSDLILGEPYSLPGIEPYCEEFMRRRIISYKGRPVGHISFGGFRKMFRLWLQNYAGYYHHDFFLDFTTEEFALERAAEILTEWQTNNDRPTWVA